MKALLSGVALAAMKMSKDNQMPCYSSSHIVAVQPHLPHCSVACRLISKGWLLHIPEKLRPWLQEKGFPPVLVQ
jgi:hypothetical protein